MSGLLDGVSACGILVIRGTLLVFDLRLRFVLLYGFGSAVGVGMMGVGFVVVASKNDDTSTGSERWGSGASGGAFSAL